MSRRKPRDLTQEERALWKGVADSASPLLPNRPLAPIPPPAGRKTPEKPHPPTLPPLVRKPVEPGRVTYDLAPDPLAPGRAGLQMDRRRYEKLRRGRIAPEARLDLHGMTSDHAHAALISFIGSAHAQGLRLVLVITGKGRPSDHWAAGSQGHGILRHSLPHWLNAPPVKGRILEVSSAHRRHGGGGAFYVYLRRQR
jgi:DNA-nicking Smr family endonuclease